MAAIKGHPGLYWRTNSSVIWATWWCKRCSEHPRGGKHRKSCETDLIKTAEEQRRKFIEETNSKKAIIDIEQITVNYLLDRYLNKTDIQKSTLAEYEDLCRKHLRSSLGNHLATDLIYDGRILENFVKGKQTEKWKRGKKKKAKEYIGYSTSRINAMLQLIASAYEHCHVELNGMRPVIPKLADHSARKTFFTDKEIQNLLSHLPDEIVRPLRVLDMTSWRSWSEMFSRKRKHWNKQTNQLILEPYETKNSEPRIFPLTSELIEILQEQETVTKAIEREKGKLIPWLFHDPEGNPLVYQYEVRDCYKPSRYFRKHWKRALKECGLTGRRIHDFRRTGIRRFSEAGIDDATGMQLSGHKSLRIYHDYKAINESDLIEATKKLSGRSAGHITVTFSGKNTAKK